MLGDGHVDAQCRPVMGSEDFAYMVEKVPAAMPISAMASAVGGGCMVYKPNYEFNDDILAVGASFWVRLTQVWLAS